MDIKDKIEDAISLELALHRLEILNTLQDYCKSFQIKSPIEKLFCAAWIANVTSLSPFYVVPQVPVSIGKRNFKIDFEIKLIDTCSYYVPNPHFRVGVEIDGHDYHERTKQQARKDKQRQRILESHNWRIIRFTGSEVYEAAFRAADSSMAFAQKVYLENYNLSKVRGAEGGQQENAI